MQGRRRGVRRIEHPIRSPREVRVGRVAHGLGEIGGGIMHCVIPIQ